MPIISDHPALLPVLATTRSFGAGITWTHSATTRRMRTQADSETSEFNLRFPGIVQRQRNGDVLQLFPRLRPGDRRHPQSDPIGLRGSTNTYAYVGSDPLGTSIHLDWLEPQWMRPLKARLNEEM